MFCLEKANPLHKPCKPTFDFSIDNLLRKETSEKDVITNTKNFKHETFTLFQDSRELSPLSEDEKTSQTTFNWLNCTRFKPPKIPRSRKRVGCKRYGRGPRIPFAPQQIAVLESTFTSSQYLSSECIHHLAKSLNLTETRVKIWFQNRRARFRRERESPETVSSTDGNIKINSLQSLPIHGSSGNSAKANFVPTISSRNKSGHTPHRSVPTNLNSGNAQKRKLLIPNYLSLQIKNQYQSSPLSFSTSKTNIPPRSNNVHSNNILSQAVPLNSIPLPYLATMSTSEFSLSYNNTTAAHLSRILCGGSASAFAPVTFSIPTSQEN